MAAALLRRFYGVIRMSTPNLYDPPPPSGSGAPLVSEESGRLWILLQFTGRIPRSTLWAGMVVLTIITTVAVAIAWGLGSDDNKGIGSLIGLFLICVVMLPTYWATVALQVKRWHDLNKSGWWYFICFIPGIGLAWAFIALGFLPGTRGPNRYGPDRLP